MSWLLPVFADLIEHDGWSLQIVEERSAGFQQTVEKDGLRLTYWADPSGLYRDVSATNGGWGYVEEVLNRVNLIANGDVDDFRIVARHADTVKHYLCSRAREVDVRTSRREAMNRLRSFQREHGMAESWLAGEEDYLRRRTEWKRRLSGWRGLQYWGAAALAALYLVYEYTRADNKILFLFVIGTWAAIIFGVLLALRFRKQI